MEEMMVHTIAVVFWRYLKYLVCRMHYILEGNQLRKFISVYYVATWGNPWICRIESQLNRALLRSIGPGVICLG